MHMSVRGLQTLLATSLTDLGRKDLLLSRCPAAYEGFDLSTHELADLMSIEAQTLEEYALQAHRLFYGEDLSSPEEPPILEHLSRQQELDCA
jgi:hypothetical protein